jgi:hypothetical protein
MDMASPIFSFISCVPFGLTFNSLFHIVNLLLREFLTDSVREEPWGLDKRGSSKNEDGKKVPHSNSEMRRVESGTYRIKKSYASLQNAQWNTRKEKDP